MKKQILFSILLLAFSMILFSCTEPSTPETSTQETSALETSTNQTENPDKKENFVLYRDFGAIGDGQTDDFLAIAEAHRYANSKKLSVKADAGAVYYIGNTSIGKYIDVKTDTDWTGATFIIDDRDLVVDKAKDYTNPIFRVASSADPHSVYDIKTISSDAKNIGCAPGVKSLAFIEDQTSRIFIRTGTNAGKGDTKREVVLVDENGNIDESTPLTWNYENISSITFYPIDEEILTIRGGIFQTIANHQPKAYTYYNRNISVERSRTVLENITHTTEGENIEGGAPYAGFIRIHLSTDVTVKDCVVTPHYIYGDITGKESATYGYDINVNLSNNVRFIGCTQTISIDDTGYWGVFTCNFARNIFLEDCLLSRFDAHRGVYNVTIKNCTFGHQGMRFTGFGLFTVENTTIRSNNFIFLRSDYGSTFDGKIVIKNCVFEPQSQLHSKSELIRARNNCNHYYGYSSHFPEIEIDGLIINDLNATGGYHGIYILPTYTERTDYNNFNTQSGYFLPEKITLKNITTRSEKTYQLYQNASLYAGMKIIEH